LKSLVAIVGALLCMTSVVADDFKPGLWSGGYGALDSDRPEWTGMISRLSATDGAFRGKLHTGGELEIRLDGDAATLSIKNGETELECAATLAGDTLIGGCTGGSQPLTFQLVRELDLPEAELKKLAGSYRDDKGHLLNIRKSIHLILTDFHTGAVRVLYADGPNRFAMGQRLAVPRPTDMTISFETDDDGVGRSVSIQDGYGRIRQAKRSSALSPEEFTFTNDGVTLAGSLYLPQGAGPHPAVIFVHGSGPVDRGGAGNWPGFLVDQGFAVLAYDKRGQGASGGSYTLPDGGRDNQPHMKRRSTDVLAALQALQKRDDIDAKTVGLVGGSQAGWVMPMVAEKGGVAFTVTLSGGATELSIEGRYSGLADERGSGGRPVEELIEELRKYKPTDYDFRPHFIAQKAPGLWLYGGNDRSNPSVLCIELLEAIKRQHGNDFTIHYFPDANHGLLKAIHGGEAESSALPGFVPEMYTTVGDWLDSKGFTRKRQ
jgi:dienelactone hydrolase